MFRVSKKDVATTALSRREQHGLKGKERSLLNAAKWGRSVLKGLNVVGVALDCNKVILVCKEKGLSEAAGTTVEIVVERGIQLSICAAAAPVVGGVCLLVSAPVSVAVALSYLTAVGASFVSNKIMAATLEEEREKQKGETYSEFLDRLYDNLPPGFDF
ncbi:hypothetical protein niasHS_007774 [Heterodera schachtii]|uniref:Uncharacterized protein n=1 Tax=Heterodera schachtii TaxID=97005 RepID=A0ABD2JPL1_HETSC